VGRGVKIAVGDGRVKLGSGVTGISLTGEADIGWNGVGVAVRLGSAVTRSRTGSETLAVKGLLQLHAISMKTNITITSVVCNLKGK
jgi:hypothetical protein